MINLKSLLFDTSAEVAKTKSKWKGLINIEISLLKDMFQQFYCLGFLPPSLSLPSPYITSYCPSSTSIFLSYSPLFPSIFLSTESFLLPVALCSDSPRSISWVLSQISLFTSLFHCIPQSYLLLSHILLFTIPSFLFLSILYSLT